MHVFYRFSDKGNDFDRPEGFNKWNCLENFMDTFEPESMSIIADGCEPETIKKLESLFHAPVMETALGNSKSFMYALNIAVTMHEDTIVYFVEDDYLHRKGADKILLEGFDVGADYVTLYDHPDKYTRMYNNGEWSHVYLSDSCHWKTTVSTTMTFAAKVKTLREDYKILQFFNQDSVPRDHEMFSQLRQFGRKLVSPIPGFSTHCMNRWLSPFCDEWVVL